MGKPHWIQRFARKMRRRPTLPVRPDDFVTLSLLRLEDRVLLDAAGLVADLGQLANVSPSAAAGPPVVSLPDADPQAADQVVEPAAAEAATSADPSTVEIVRGELVFRAAGDSDVANQLMVSSDGQRLTFRDLSGAPIVSTISSASGAGTDELSIAFSSLTGVGSLVIDVGGGDDSVTFDLSQGDDALLSQFQSTRLLPSADRVRFMGDGTQNAAYRLGAGEGANVTIVGAQDTSGFSFEVSDAVDLTGMNLARIVMPPTTVAGGELTIAEGTSVLSPNEDALVARWEVGGAELGGVHFHDNATVVVESSEQSQVSERITLRSAANDHGNANLILRTSEAADGGQGTVLIEGDVSLTGDFEATTGRLTVNSPIKAIETAAVIASGDIQFGDGGSLAARTASLTAGGRIIADSRAGEIVAELVQLTAGSGIGAASQPLVTSAETLRLNVTGPGSLFVRDTGDVSVVKAHTANGSIDLTAAGSLTARNVLSVTNAETNNIRLRAETGDVTLTGRVNVGNREAPAGDVSISAPQGRIVDVPSEAESFVVADVLTLNAFTGIGTSDNRFGTSVNQLTLDVDGLGSVYINETSSFNLASATARQGVIDVTVLDSLTVGDVTAGGAASGPAIRFAAVTGDVTVEGALRAETSAPGIASSIQIAANGRIANTSGGDAPRFIADFVDLSAGSGIGAADQPLVTSAETLRLNVTGPGSLFVRDAGDVSVVKAHTADGSIDLAAFGSLTVRNVLSVTNADANDIRLQAETGDVTVSGRVNVGAREAPAGDVTILAPRGRIVDVPSETAESFVVADVVTLNAATGIGSADNRFGTSINQLSLEVSGIGSVYINETSTVNLVSATTRQGIIDVRVLDSILVGNVRARSTAPGVDTRIVADFGEITVAGSLTAEQLFLQGTSITVLENALLSGGGTVVGDVFVQPTGAFAPGSSSVARTAIQGSLTLESLANVRFVISSPTESTSASVRDAASLDGSVLTLSVGQFNLPPGSTFTLLESLSDASPRGTFRDVIGASLPEGAELRLGQAQAVLTYAGGVGLNDVILTTQDQSIVTTQNQYIPPPIVTAITSVLSGTGATQVKFEQPQPTLPIVQENTRTIPPAITVERAVVEVEAAPEDDFRLFFRAYDDALDQEDENDVKLPAEDLDRLPEAFEEFAHRGLPDGHYKVYLQEAGSRRQRVVQDIYVFDGKVVPKNYLQEMGMGKPAAEKDGPSADAANGPNTSEEAAIDDAAGAES